MTTPYIGSKISLISQLDIRYEGLLHKVDPVDSTISLSKVSSFGTEDRIANVIVPARKEVYDYIIFKASDIKDLIVCDTPKPAMPDVNDITYDPAIISVSKPVTGMLPSTDEHNVIQGSEASGPHPIAYRQVEMRHQIKEPKELPSNDHSLSGRFGQTARQQFYNQDAIQGQRQSHKFVSMRQEHSMPRVFQSQEHIPYQQQRPYHGNEHRHINDHRIHQHFYYNQHARASKKYEGDFDFEKANEDFLESVDDVFENIGQLDLERRDSQLSPTDKSSINEIDELTNNKAIMIHDKSNKNDVYYDKNRSFFDNISCDATERESGKDNKIDWKKERITNEITFGSSAVRLHNFHRHGSRGGAAHQHFRRGGYVYNQQRRYGAGPPGSNNRGSGDGYASKQYKERN